MSIVSSVTSAINPQADGRRWVQERHTDQVGIVYERNWLADAQDDLAAALATYATQLAANLTQAEIDTNVRQITLVGSLAAPTFVYSTAAQSRTALRVAYQTATRVDAIMIGDFLNTLTDAQLQSAFSMTALQVTTLRTNKLTPAASLATSIRAAAGQ